MKRRCLSTGFCILGVALIIIGQMVRENREMMLYGDALKRCEWVWKNWKEYREKEISEWFTPYDGFLGYAPGAEKYGYDIVYCIQDLNSDGTPELIVGVQRTETQAINIKNIYCYEDGDLKVDWQDRYGMEIYKGGIIEDCIGTCSSTEYYYYWYLPYSGKTEYLGGLKHVEEPPKFYKMILFGKNELKIEIAEEEYNRQKELYTGQGKEELQWKELQGFLEEGETFESLFGDYYPFVAVDRYIE